MTKFRLLDGSGHMPPPGSHYEKEYMALVEKKFKAADPDSCWPFSC